MMWLLQLTLSGNQQVSCQAHIVKLHNIPTCTSSTLVYAVTTLAKTEAQNLPLSSLATCITVSLLTPSTSNKLQDRGVRPLPSPLPMMLLACCCCRCSWVLASGRPVLLAATGPLLLLAVGVATALGQSILLVTHPSMDAITITARHDTRSGDSSSSRAQGHDCSVPCSALRKPSAIISIASTAAPRPSWRPLLYGCC